MASQGIRPAPTLPAPEIREPLRNSRGHELRFSPQQGQHMCYGPHGLEISEEDMAGRHRAMVEARRKQACESPARGA